MATIAKVLNIQIGANTIDPCVGVARGLDIAARAGAKFILNLQFVYTVAGGARGRVTAAVELSKTRFVQLLDPVTAQVETSVATQQSPLKGSRMTCMASITIVDPATQAVVQIGDTEISDLPVP